MVILDSNCVSELLVRIFIFSGHQGIFELLIKNGAKLNGKNVLSDEIVFIWAAANGNYFQIGQGKIDLNY